MAIAELHIAPARDTRATRDTGVDLVRAFCVLGVVVLHSLMVGVTVTEAGPIFANASDGAAWIIPLSWVFQVMPLFFVIGGFAGYTSYQRSQSRGGTPAAFASARIHRLLLPAVITVTVAAIALTALLAYGVSPEMVGIAGFRFSQPLWFLGVFLLCQVLLPALVKAHERAPWPTVSLIVAAAVAVDVVRHVTGIDGIGFANLAFVWLAAQQLGFFLADGTIPALARRTRKVIGLSAAGALVLAFVFGVYSPDLIANTNPPTTALLLVGLAHTMVVSLIRERLIGWSNHPIGRGLRQFVTPRAMTVYLWHMSVLLTMAGMSAVFAITTGIALPEPSSIEWWLTRPLWLTTALVLTATDAWALARIEARPAPQATRSCPRLVAASTIGIAAVVLLLVLGTTALTGFFAAVMMFVALRLARTRRGPASERAESESLSPSPLR